MWGRIHPHPTCLSSNIQLLHVGNTINRQRPGPAREARAFKLSSLSKFADMRTPDKALSLLDVVVEALELDCPRHCDEVRSGGAATSIQSNDVTPAWCNSNNL